MGNQKVSIIVLQFNNSEDAIACLESVKELDYPNLDIIIVDNDSEAKHVNSVRFFVANEKKIGSQAAYELIEAGANLGYAGGNNLGIKRALGHGADYVFILNPDVRVEHDTLAKLVKRAETDPRLSIVGPAINEGERIIYGGAVEWLKPELKHAPVYQLGAKSYKLFIPGAAMLIKREVIETIGLPDERYFLYFEDADYCVRARATGYELAIATEAQVTHAVSSATHKLGSSLLLRYHYRNAHLFNWLRGPGWARLALPFWSIYIIIKQLAKIILARDQEVSKAILVGVFDFYNRRFGRIDD